MPQQIEVPGHGIVEFPDGMTDEQISDAIQRNLSTSSASEDLLKRERTDHSSLSLDEKKQLVNLRKQGAIPNVNRGTEEEHAKLASKGMSIPGKMWAGFGSTLPSIGRGIQQIVNRAPTEEAMKKGGWYMPDGSYRPFLPGEIEARDKRVTPVNELVDEEKKIQTGLGGWGTTGKVIGDIGLTAPLLAVPGLNTVRGSSLIGGWLGALQPT